MYGWVLGKSPPYSELLTIFEHSTKICKSLKLQQICFYFYFFAVLDVIIKKVRKEINDLISLGSAYSTSATGTEQTTETNPGSGQNGTRTRDRWIASLARSLLGHADFYVTTTFSSYVAYIRYPNLVQLPLLE